jgi:hypothetical protein
VTDAKLCLEVQWTVVYIAFLMCLSWPAVIEVLHSPDKTSQDNRWAKVGRDRVERLKKGVRASDEA